MASTGRQTSTACVQKRYEYSFDIFVVHYMLPCINVLKISIIHDAKTLASAVIHPLDASAKKPSSEFVPYSF